jgi:2-keto-4-pentenoate hydratase
MPMNDADRKAEAIARQFVNARLQARALADFPGDIPADLAGAYRVQDAAIALWPDRVAGWKVGFIAPHRRDDSNDERLVGPVFSQSLWRCEDGAEVSVPVFENGFAAVEAEFAFRLGADAPADQYDWTGEQAAVIAADLHIAVETAGSPLATINALGPIVVVSDFGNNAGLILGPAIAGWRQRSDASMTCSTWIEGHEVGSGSAASLPGGVLSALAFALSRNARRGRPLKAGDIVTTGAATGIHDIRAGQSADIRFGALGSLRCRAFTAEQERHAHAS